MENLSSKEFGEVARVGAALRGVSFKRGFAARLDLRGADLRGADFSNSRLIYSDLRGADLRGLRAHAVELTGTDLSGANLEGADLKDAVMAGVRLRGANLQSAKLPLPPDVLKAHWGRLSRPLTIEMLRYVAACHPDPVAIDVWAKGGEVTAEFVRGFAARFDPPPRTAWTPGPCPRPYDLMNLALAEVCPPWTEEQRQMFGAERFREM